MISIALIYVSNKKTFYLDTLGQVSRTNYATDKHILRIIINILRSERLCQLNCCVLYVHHKIFKGKIVLKRFNLD